MKKAKTGLVEPLLPSGRLIALYAQGKAGKSLLALEVAAALATGKPTLAQPPQPPLSVIYIDQEMTPDDIHDRLTDLGYNPTDNLDYLYYYQLQTFWPFDTAQGGEQLLDIVNQHQARLVILDTVARLVDGPENDADTYTAAYRHTLRPLKARGVTILRLDHAGKDPGKGQRGSSAKNDDVDVVWRLTAKDDKITLNATRSRLGWIPTTINLTRSQNPTKHHLDKQPLTTKYEKSSPSSTNSAHPPTPPAPKPATPSPKPTKPAETQPSAQPSNTAETPQEHPVNNLWTIKWTVQN